VGRVPKKVTKWKLMDIMSFLEPFLEGAPSADFDAPLNMGFLFYSVKTHMYRIEPR